MRAGPRVANDRHGCERLRCRSRGSRRCSRPLIVSNQPVALPSRSCKPCPPRFDWSTCRFPRRWPARWRHLPAVEPPRRRAQIKAGRFRRVLATVRNDVHETVPYFSRRSKSARVITVRPELSAAAQDAIDSTRNANREPRHSARERRLVLGFHYEVDVIRLHREVYEPKPRASRSREGTPHFKKYGLLAQARQLSHCAQCDVHRMVLLVLRSCLVTEACSLRAGLAPCAVSLAAPGGRERECLLTVTLHLIEQYSCKQHNCK
jgi:hypothetical protein